MKDALTRALSRIEDGSVASEPLLRCESGCDLKKLCERRWLCYSEVINILVMVAGNDQDMSRRLRCQISKRHNVGIGKEKFSTELTRSNFAEDALHDLGHQCLISA
jgi:hypothetical protein